MPDLESPLLDDLKLEMDLAGPPPRTYPHPVPQKPGFDIFRKVGTKELCQMARQLSALLHAGMPLVPALSALAEQLRCPTSAHVGTRKAAPRPLARVIEQIRDEVNEGGSFAEALHRHPGTFSPLFVNMVAAGESSGALEEVLARLADILEKRVQLAGKVKAAITYPTTITFVAVAVVTFLISYVVPGITRLFVEMHKELPWPTRFLISVSNFMQTYMLLLLVAFCAAVIGLVAWYKSREGKIRADRVILRLPLFGPLLFRLELARLTRTLGTLMKSGIPVITAMEITQRVIQNTLIADAMKAIRESVQKGESVADAVRITGIFPPVVFHLLSTGQMSGNIEDGLIDIAEMYDTEVETTVRTLTSLLEPVILMVMGAVVGFIVLAILLPVFEINQAL
jgi:general secretion pathway protein F